MSYSEGSHIRLRRGLLYAIALLPAGLTGLLIWRYSVDVPQWEDWIMVPIFEKFASGTLFLRELFAQQNEYRQFFPNLLFLGLGWLTKWDLRYEMLVSFLLACLISINIYQLSRQTTANDRGLRPWLYLMANLLIFSTVQHENWLQGQQVIYFIPVACVTTCLVIASSERFRITGKCLWCAALSVISTFSSANGFLCWLVILPVLNWSPNGASAQRQKWLIRIAWLTGLVLSMTLYFHGLRNLQTLRQFSQASPLSRACLFFLSLLGGALSIGQIAIAIPIGAFLLTLFALTCRLFLRLRSDPVAAKSVLGWLMLGTYSIMTAALITFGRVGFGLQYALQNRYTTYTLYLPVALIYLIPLLLTNARGRVRRYLKPVQARFVPVLAAALIAVQLPIYVKDFRFISVFRLSLLQAKACLLYGEIVNDSCSTFLFPPHAAVLRPYANVLDGLGFLRPPLVRDNRLPDIEDPRSVDYGAFLQVVQVNTKDYIASGWAMLPQRGEPPDVVLLAFERDDATASPFAIATLETERDFVSALMRRGVYGDVRWSKSFSVNGLPVGPHKLSAWAFDAQTGRAYRIAGTHIVGKPVDSAQR